MHEAEKHVLYGGDMAEGRSLGERANRLGREFGDVDLEMMGQAMVGLAAEHEVLSACRLDNISAGLLDRGMGLEPVADQCAQLHPLFVVWAGRSLMLGRENTSSPSSTAVDDVLIGTLLRRCTWATWRARPKPGALM